jgi:hypothetical protein
MIWQKDVELLKRDDLKGIGGIIDYEASTALLRQRRRKPKQGTREAEGTTNEVRGMTYDGDKEVRGTTYVGDEEVRGTTYDGDEEVRGTTYVGDEVRGTRYDVGNSDNGDNGDNGEGPQRATTVTPGKNNVTTVNNSGKGDNGNGDNGDNGDNGVERYFSARELRLAHEKQFAQASGSKGSEDSKGGKERESKRGSAATEEADSEETEEQKIRREEEAAEDELHATEAAEKEEELQGCEVECDDVDSMYVLTSGQRAILQAVLAGGIYHGRRLAHMLSNEKLRVCAHCGHESEDIEHIFWHCPAWAPIRADVLKIVTLEDIGKWPACTRCCGIFQQKRDYTPYQERVATETRDYKVERPPTYDRKEVEEIFDHDGFQLVATDAACPRQQTHVQLRRAGGGIYYGPNHPMNRDEKLPSIAQNAQRGELHMMKK